jgi:hypothetical protein
MTTPIKTYTRRRTKQLAFLLEENDPSLSQTSHENSKKNEDLLKSSFDFNDSDQSLFVNKKRNSFVSNLAIFTLVTVPGHQPPSEKIQNGKRRRNREWVFQKKSNW